MDALIGIRRLRRAIDTIMGQHINLLCYHITRFKHTGKRNEIFLATKFGVVLENGRPSGAINGTPEYCKAQIEKSLARLEGE